MKSTSILYEDTKSLRRLIDQGDLLPEVSYLVRIYISNASREEAFSISREIKKLFPLACIVGCTVSGVIYKGEQHNEENLVVFEQYEEAELFTAGFCWRDKSASDIAGEIAGALKGKEIRVAHILCGDHYYDVHNFVEELNKLVRGVHVAGGVAGDVLPLNLRAFVFTDQGIIEDGIVIAAISGKGLNIYSGAITNHEPISPKYRLTQIEDGCWKTVNDQPVETWLLEQLGIETLKEYDDWKILVDNDEMVRFPMILEGQKMASRFLKYDGDIKGITQYFSRIPVGSEFRIGYVSPLECVKEGFTVCNDIMQQPVESLFCYSCLFRRLYLHNCAEWELSPYKDLNLSGAFIMGEFSYIDGQVEFLNGSLGMLATAEHQVFVRPDMDVFEDLYKIEDDNRDLLNFVLKRQSDNISRHNEQLLGELLSQQQYSKDQLFIDYITKIPNYLKYKEDKKGGDFDKLCMVKVENADLLVTHLGHETYIRLLQKAVAQVGEYIHSLKEYRLLHCYIFNENTLFLTSDSKMSECHFMELCKELFNRYSFIRFDEDEDNVLVTRFVVVFGQEDLIESALNTFQANKNIQMPFLICEKETASAISAEDEFQIIGVLNRAIEGDGIIPYFQGIYDNREKKLTKYEALMRIIDQDGKIYYPAQFMGVAKKYHLYSHLSQRMMEKVFHIFKGRKETVSINFSVYDLNSPKMQDVIFHMLDEIGDASNFILEILEDEEFRDPAMLKDFLIRAKSYGVKVAIDDFGSGYSNLLEIASIEPDFIKVDGGIIKQIHQNERNLKILDIIVYLGKMFQTEIVAEFVENEEIQLRVANRDINYSQGFYFARPLPFEELGLKG